MKWGLSAYGMTISIIDPTITETKGSRGKHNTQKKIMTCEGKGDHMGHLKVCKIKLKTTFSTNTCVLATGGQYAVVEAT